MDPICAIGLASAVVTLIDVGTKVAKRVKELSETGDIPDVFRDIKTRLPLILSVVARTQNETHDLSLEAQEAIAEVVRQCAEQAAQLHEILKKVVVVQGDSRLKKTVKAGVVSTIRAISSQSGLSSCYWKVRHSRPRSARQRYAYDSPAAESQDPRFTTISISFALLYSRVAGILTPNHVVELSRRKACSKDCHGTEG